MTASSRSPLTHSSPRARRRGDGGPGRPSGQGPPTTTLGVLQLVWRVNHTLERRSRRMHASLGITAPQRMVLRLIGQSPDITAGDLAATLHVDRGTLSSALRRLERRRLLTRHGDAHDGRVVHLRLTDRGRKFDTASPETVEAAVNAVLARCSSSDVRAARRVLAALARELDREPDTERAVERGGTA